MILGARVALKHRNVRKFVRSVRTRTALAKEKGLSMQETVVEKPQKNPRSSAIELQKLRTLLCEAEKVEMRGQYEEAEKILIKAITVSPESLEARARLAKLYLLTHAEPKAEALYRELIAERNDVSFYANLGLSCYKQEKFDDACAAYYEAMELDPRNPERTAALGRSCIAAGRLPEAATLLEKASERLARDTSLLQLLGECYESLGNPSMAEDAYSRLHKLVPYDQNIKEKLVALAAA